MGRSYVQTEPLEKALVEIVGTAHVVPMLLCGLAKGTDHSNRFVVERIILPYIETSMIYDDVDREESFKLHCRKLMDVYADYPSMLNAYGTLRRHYGTRVHRLRRHYFQAGFDNVEVELVQ